MNMNRALKYGLLLLTVLLLCIGCSKKTPIEKYKEDLEKKGIQEQVKDIESQKEQLAQINHEQLDEATKAINAIVAKNNELKKTLEKIKLKDEEVLKIHQLLLDYVSQNDELMTKELELIDLYKVIVSKSDTGELETTFSQMVELGRTIEEKAKACEESRVKWLQGIVLLDNSVESSQPPVEESSQGSEAQDVSQDEVQDTNQ